MWEKTTLLARYLATLFGVPVDAVIGGGKHRRGTERKEGGKRERLQGEGFHRGATGREVRGT